jgi:hypothetical protein
MRLRLRFVAVFLCLGAPALARAQPAPAQPSAPPPATSPLTIRIGDAEILPGGFIDALGIFRSTNVASGPPTTFATIPFENTPQGNLNDTRFTAQGSRLNALLTANVGNAAMKAFIEIDFIGNDAGSAYVYSDSHVPRMRLGWAQYSRGKFEFTAGQAWSLLVPNRVGLSPATGDVFVTQNLDANLQVGLAWSRPAQFRFVVRPSDSVSAGVSVQNPQQYVGAAVVLPASFPASEVDTNGTLGTPNRYPDVVGKVAFDPKTGETRQHVEAGVFVRGFKTYSPASDRAYSATGTGATFNAVVQPVKAVRVMATSLISDGGGRYMIGLAPDFIVNADASITTVGSKSFLVGAEAQARPATMVFGYYGTVRIDRQVSDDQGQQIGYGIDGSTTANRCIDETTLGVNHSIFRAPQYGALQLIVQYSFLKRTPWAVPANTPLSATLHMVYVSARYVLP